MLVQPCFSKFAIIFIHFFHILKANLKTNFQDLFPKGLIIIVKYFFKIFMRYDEKIKFVCKRFRYSIFNKDEMRTFYKSRCSRTSKVILPDTLLTDLHVKRSNKRKKLLLKIQTYKKFGKRCWLFFSRFPFNSNKQSFIQSFFGNLFKISAGKVELILSLTISLMQFRKILKIALM